MNHKTNANYADWVMRLVNTCLPLDLQVRIVTGQPITQEEFEQFANVILLVGQSKGLRDHAQIIAQLDNLSTGMRHSHDIEKAILAVVNGEDPMPAKTDHRRLDSIREAMVLLAAQSVFQRPQSDSGAICQRIFSMFKEIPGSYDNFKSFQQQVRRVVATYRN